MMVEFARNRIAKMRNDYSKDYLDNKLGLFNNNGNEEKASYLVNWSIKR